MTTTWYGPEFERLPSGEVIVSNLRQGWCNVPPGHLLDTVEWSRDGRFWPYYVARAERTGDKCRVKFRKLKEAK